MLNIHVFKLLWGRRAVAGAALALSLASLCAVWSPVQAAGPANEAASAPALSAGAQVTATIEPLPTAPMPTEAPTEPSPTAVPESPVAPPEQRELIRGDQMVTGGSYTLRSGQTLRGDLTILGGEAILEEGSRVEGSVSVLGGVADVAGTITEDVNMVGGSVRLRASARVDGDVNVMGGEVTKDPGASVGGETNRFTGPRIAPIIPPGVESYAWEWNGPFRGLFDFAVNALAILSGVILITLFSIAAVALFPNNVACTAAAIKSQWLLSGAIGALTFVAAPILAVLLSITICLIPVAVLLALAWAVAILFGWAIVARMVGEWAMAGLKRDNWTLIGQTAAGAVLLALLGSIPIFGWLVGFAATSVGVGALILTRFGSQPYPRYSAPAARLVAAPLPAVVPSAPQPSAPQPSAPQLPAPETESAQPDNAQPPSSTPPAA